MPTEAKRETVAALTEEARSATAMIVSEYRGLKVSELGEIRRNLRKQNVTYHVVKNRLMKIAAVQAGTESLGASCCRDPRRSPSSAATRRQPPRRSSTRSARTR